MIIPNMFGLYSACINNVWGIVDEKGNEIIRLKFNFIYCIEYNILAYKGGPIDDYKWGLIDINGRPITPCKYDCMPIFKDNLAWVVKSNKIGFINKEGIEIIPPIYQGAFKLPNSNDLFAVNNNNLWGILNSSEDLIVEFEHEKILKTYEDGYFIVSKERHQGANLYPKSYGLMNISGEIVLPPLCYQIGYKNYEVSSHTGDDLYDNTISENLFVGGVVKFQIGKKWNFLTKEDCDKLHKYSFYIMRNSDFSKFEYFNIMRGSKLIDIENDFDRLDNLYDYDLEFDGEAEIAKQLFSNLFQGLFDEVGLSNDGIVRIRNGNKYCFIDCHTREELSNHFDFANDFRNGLAKVNIGGCFEPDTYEGSYNEIFRGGKWGFINKEFEIHIPLVYDELSSFMNGFAYEKVNGVKVRINLQGEVVEVLSSKNSKF